MRVLDTDVLITDVLHRGKVGVVNAQYGSALHANDVAILDDERRSRCARSELEADLHGIAPFGIPEDGAPLCAHPGRPSAAAVTVGLQRDAVILGAQEAVFHAHVPAGGDVDAVIVVIANSRA